MVNILFEYEETWNHSLTCGIIAGHIAETSKQCDSNDAFVAALLHDIGYIILHQIVNDDMDAIRYSKNGRLRTTVEAASGVSHSEAGFWIAGKWQLPPRIAETIRYHHAPHLARLIRHSTATVHVAEFLFPAPTRQRSHDGPLAMTRQLSTLSSLMKPRLIANSWKRSCMQMRSDIDGGRSLEDFVSDIKRKFVDAIGDLPEKQRIILALYDYENISFEEIGRVLKIDETAVMSLHDKSLTTLKNLLWNIQPQRVAL